LIRPEATGYGTVCFAKEMLATQNDDFRGKNVVISGSGNVAQFALQKVIQLGGKVLTVSDSSGFVYAKDGFHSEHLDYLMELKNVRRGRVKEIADKFEGFEFHEGGKPWGVPADVALPCATQNELNGQEAEMLVNNGVKCVAEGANMPCTPEAIENFQKGGVLFSPGKASNAGGVATSGLEMSQNSLRMNWSSEEVDQKLHGIMVSIHEACVKYGKTDGGNIDYVKGANIAGFVKIADAMIDQGLV
jgi:glutamate dehydrogenase (NADP+)